MRQRCWGLSKVVTAHVAIIAGICLVILDAQAQEPAQLPAATPWQMPVTEKAEWLKTFKLFSPGDGWKVTSEGNDFIIEYANPVKFYYSAGGSMVGDSRIGAEAPFRVTLRFSPKLTPAQQKAHEENNTAAEKQHYMLLDKYKIRQKFDQYSLFGTDTKQRAASYRTEAAGLKHYLLPQYYSLDYSITAFQSWHFLYHLDENGQEELAQKCAELLGAIRRLFGTYEARNAQNEWWAYPERLRAQPLYPVVLTDYGGKD